MADEDVLDSPYWLLGPEPDGTGVLGLVRTLPASVRPVARMVWDAAPRAAVAVLVLQVGAGLAVTLGLLGTADVLHRMLAAGPTAERVGAALPALAVVTAAFALRGLLETAVSFARARVVPAVRLVAEQRVAEAALGVRLTAFDEPDFYDRLHRARDRGLYHVERATDNLIEVVGTVFAVVAASTSLGVLHPVLLPLLVLCAAPQAWSVVKAARTGHVGMVRAVSLSRRMRMLGDLAADREAAAEIRACQAASFLETEIAQAADALRAHEIAVGTAQARTVAVGRACGGLAVAATFIVLGLLLRAEWIPLAVAGAAVVAMRSAIASLRGLVTTASQVVEQGLYVADYQAFLVEARARSRPAGGSVVGSPGVIRFEDVHFRYPGAGTDTLTGIDLAIARGEVVAFVGENGSGKSTLAKLVAGLYAPTSGRITWDGVDTSGVCPTSLADNVAMVLQHPVRWPHDAGQNVRIGRPASRGGRDLEEVARISGADEVVARLPDGWRTLLSKKFRGGVELSGGQWQRLAVARGLYRDAPVVVWDEPTAPLDAKAEFAVFETLRRVAHGRTVVLITHRLASARNADRVHLVHNGRIVESGTHDELVASGGQYHDLYALQAAMYSDATNGTVGRS